MPECRPHFIVLLPSIEFPQFRRRRTAESQKENSTSENFISIPEIQGLPPLMDLEEEIHRVVERHSTPGPTTQGFITSSDAHKVHLDPPQIDPTISSSVSIPSLPGTPSSLALGSPEFKSTPKSRFPGESKYSYTSRDLHSVPWRKPDDSGTTKEQSQMSTGLMMDRSIHLSRHLPNGKSRRFASRPVNRPALQSCDLTGNM